MAYSHQFTCQRTNWNGNLHAAKRRAASIPSTQGIEVRQHKSQQFDDPLQGTHPILTPTLLPPSYLRAEDHFPSKTSRPVPAGPHCRTRLSYALLGGPLALPVPRFPVTSESILPANYVFFFDGAVGLCRLGKNFASETCILIGESSEPWSNAGPAEAFECPESALKPAAPMIFRSS